MNAWPDDMPKPDWQSDDGSAILYCGDCLDILPKLPDGCVDAVVTDPPYGIAKGAAFVRGNCTRIDDASGAFNENQDWRWIEQCEYLRDGGNVAVFAKREDTLPQSIREWHRYYLIKDSAPPVPRKVFVSAVEQCLIGSKRGGVRGWHGSDWEPNYWRGLTPKRRNDGTQSGHPAEKPLVAIEQLVRCLVGKTETALDPFMGSGTTGVACVRLGRRFIGIELEERYFSIACKRIQQAFDDQGLFRQAESSQHDKSGKEMLYNQ